VSQNRPKKPVKDFIGPIRPRIFRVRTKHWQLPLGASGKGTTLIENPPPPHLAANNPFYWGDRDNYMWVKDTVRNPEWDYRYPLKDDGGEFLSRSGWWQHWNVPVHGRWFGGTRTFGDVPVSRNDGFHDGIWAASSKYGPTIDYTDIPSFGPTGWARARPDRPAFNFGQSVVELRELPMMLKTSVESLKDIASYYVGLEFGWGPILSDIKNLFKMKDRLEKIIASIRRNNGLPVRRTSKILNSNESNVILNQVGIVGLASNTKAWSGLPASEYGAGYRQVIFRKTRAIWFAGKFITWIDDLDAPNLDTRLTARLLGFYPSPKLVWDLIPWSWLIDWFTNVGDLISNISSTWADREAAVYAYIMGNTHRSYTWTGSDGKFSASSTKHYSTKCRYHADRFGLQTGSALSLTQQAILAALGLLRIGV